MVAEGMGEPETEATERAQDYARHANLTLALAALSARRDEILERWLEVVARQPFHCGRRERAVADDIPALFDAVLATLARGAPVWLEPEAPQENPAVAAAARGHATARSRQGLQAADVVVEFRLLRQEIWRALREELPDSAPTGDLLAAQLLLNDAIDGAMGVGIAVFVRAVEEAKEEILLTAAHDLRNPLTGIKGTAQLIARQFRRPQPDLARIERGLGQIDEQATRMMVLIAELLDASRVRLGRFEVSRAPTEFRAVLDAVVSRCPPAERARLHIRATLASVRPGQWDAARLERVLENLLSNALKFSPPDSPIEIAVDGTAAGLAVAVRDHGRGLEGQELTRLFDRFYRAPDVAEAAIEGSGLGLYIVRGIVEAHGGRIWAASEGHGQGTTIQFTLPWDAPTDAPRA
ncbi:MAG TPA: sensor histidine kinase [Chloroflexota bacterium]|nr:sensor histidine kinase [Chloroflexota bacterium]